MDGGIGEPIVRKEDLRLLTGKGRYADDNSRPDQTYAHFLRAPVAHARIKNISTGAAKNAPGVVGVFTSEDFVADGYEPRPFAGNMPPDVVNPPDPGLAPRPGTEFFEIPSFPFAYEKVRKVGECVALVVAETLTQAKDAAELIEIDYETLPAVADAAEALAPGAPQVWDHIPGNAALKVERGDAAATEKAFAAAAHTVKLRLRNNRVGHIPMEPRAQLVHYDTESERFTFNLNQNRTYMTKMGMARILRVEPDQVHVLRGDVGGAFGARGGAMHENALCGWAARKLGRAIKWTSERSDSMVSDTHARELDSVGELALDADGRFLALRIDHTYNIGAVALSYVPLSNGIRLVTGSYRFPTAYAEGTAVVTNTVSTSTYRGAGRPEAIYNLERLIDAAAAETGLDRVDIRRRNLLTPDELPHRNPMGVPYDSGEFEVMMDQALEMADWKGFAKRREGSERRGVCRGIGIANYIQNTTGHPPEWTAIEVKPNGTVDVAMGVDSSGQGHETSFAQVVSEWLGVPYEDVNFLSGDSDLIKGGSGSHSDRSMRIGGKIMLEASDLIIEKGKKIAAHELEAGLSDIEFGAGKFTVIGTDRSISIFEVAAAAAGNDLPDGLGGPLREEVAQEAYIPGYPSGTAICEVEVDPDTGKVTIHRYSSVDDVGQAINPLIVDGQTAGAIVQALGQAALEHFVYEPGTGQMLSGTFMDYCMPRADDLPSFGLKLHEVFAPSNTLGVKGGGEGGSLPALAAYINAIIDALRGIGVTDMEMPATPERVWQAIQTAQAE